MTFVVSLCALQKLYRTVALSAVLVLGLLSTLAVRSLASDTTGYVITDLGTLPGGASSRAYGINDAGKVVGSSDVATDAGGALHAFLWDGAVMTDLGTLPGDRHSQAYAINEVGHVVGTSWGRHYKGMEKVNHAFLWRDGVMMELGALGGIGGQALDINDADQVVGWSATSDGNYHAFLWQDDQMIDLGTLGGSKSVAHGINDVGDVVGWSETSDGSHRAFLWRDGRMFDLGTLGGSSSEARAINNAGQVVGFSAKADGPYHAFLWEDSQMTDLRPAGDYNTANAITGTGRVVGDPIFLWQGGLETDLRTLLPAESNWKLFSVRGANDSGQIVGQGSLDGQHKGFLLTPPLRTEAIISPQANKAGWHNGDVTVTLTAQGGGTIKTYYSVDDPTCSYGSASACSTYTGPFTIGADGEHSLYFFSEDSMGRSEGQHSDPIKIDRTAPTSKAPMPSFVVKSQVDGSTTPARALVRLAWAATDTGSGVAGYQLQQSTEGGSFTDVPLADGSASRTRLWLEEGRGYQFRLRAQDHAGNWSKWKVRSNFLLTSYQESNTDTAYEGNWTMATRETAYGGALARAASSTDSATLTFTGRNIAWVGTRGPDMGQADVYIDGTYVNTVDLYSRRSFPASVIFSRTLNPTLQHTLQVRVRGEMGASSTATQVDVDAFLIMK